MHSRAAIPRDCPPTSFIPPAMRNLAKGVWLSRVASAPTCEKISIAGTRKLYLAMELGGYAESSGRGA